MYTGSSACPREVLGASPGNAQDQVGWGSQQRGLGEDVPADCRGLDQSAFKGPFQPKLLCDGVTSASGCPQSTSILTGLGEDSPQ